jgi:hypothetical protein
MGKILSEFQSALNEDISQEVLVPNFVTLFVEDKLSLCQGLPSDVTFSSTRDVFVEEVKSKIVTRSRSCHYAVTAEQEVCEACQRFSSEKNVARYILFKGSSNYDKNEQSNLLEHRNNLKHSGSTWSEKMKFIIQKIS